MDQPAQELQLLKNYKNKITFSRTNEKKREDFACMNIKILHAYTFKVNSGTT